MTTGFDRADYFVDLTLVEDPYPYFDYLRGGNQHLSFGRGIHTRRPPLRLRLRI